MLLLAVATCAGIGGCDDPMHKIICNCMQIPAILVPTSVDQVVESLQQTYQRRDVDQLGLLLHSDFVFEFYAPPPDGVTTWDRAEELAIHRRMFQPADIQPPEPPLPSDLWLASIDVSLISDAAWEPVPGTNQFRGTYDAVIFFETQSDTDYRITGRQEFVVQVDPEKQIGDPGKFLLIHWTDFGTPGALPGGSWGRIKLLYRAPGAAEAHRALAFPQRAQ